MLNHRILRKHPSKDSQVSVVVKTTSLRNADLKMRIVGTANRKGTLPRCAKRRLQPRVQSRIGGNNQFGKMRIVGTANRKGTLPRCAKRRLQPRVQSRIGGNNQFGMRKLATNLQTIKTTSSSCSKSVKKSLSRLSCFQ